MVELGDLCAGRARPGTVVAQTWLFGSAARMRFGGMVAPVLAVPGGVMGSEINARTR